MLVYIHGIVDGVNAVFLVIILLCSTTLFIAVKYRLSKPVSSMQSLTFTADRRLSDIIQPPTGLELLCNWPALMLSALSLTTEMALD